MTYVVKDFFIGGDLFYEEVDDSIKFKTGGLVTYK